MSRVVKKPPRIREVCGTLKGYRAHQRAGEECCGTCADARLDVPSPPSAAEVASEIEWMLHLNQCRPAIVGALGYSGRESTLERRLEKHGRTDLVRRLGLKAKAVD